MRWKQTWWACVAAVVLAVLAIPPAASDTSVPPAGSPAVFFPEKVFEFPAVIDGVKVVHDFTVANKGTSPLLIDNIRTG